MKKVGIITRHAIPNYGSFLQSKATEFIINDLGYESEIINYVREDEKEENIVDTYANSRKLFGRNILTKFAYRVIQGSNLKRMNKVFKEYRNKYLKISDMVSSSDELKKICNYDIYCTGSDQVWGKIGNDNFDKNYFLDFVPENAKCISYAASFGKTQLTDDVKSDIVNLVRKYSTVLVREDSAVKFLKDSGVKNVKQVLDPTFLVSPDRWESIIEKKEIKKPYYLVYQLHHNKDFEKYIKKVKKETNAEMYRINPSIYFKFKPGKFIYLPTPGEFLYLIKNAEGIFTDSFHGTAFSIAFNKQFVDFLPKLTGTRIQSILRVFGLEDRIVTDYNNVKVIDKKIDYTRVNLILAEEKKKSLDLLKGALDE